MTPTNHKPGTLAIFVSAEIKKPCDEQFCSACHPDKSRDMGIILAGGKPYIACNGSGTRTVTLEGWVALEFGNDDYILAKGVKKYIDRISSWLHWRDNPEDIERNIAQALHDNTCPDAIRAQLHEVQP